MKRLLCFVFLITAIVCLSTPAQANTYTTATDFYNWLSNQGKLYNSDGLMANWTVYNDEYYDGTVVYGSPFAIVAGSKDYDYSKYTNRYEYRYLGYNYDGSIVLNTYFREDPGGGGDPTVWVYLDVPGAEESWSKLDPSQYEAMLNCPLSYAGIEYPTITVASIGGIKKAKVLTAPTWSSNGTIYTEHYWPN